MSPVHVDAPKICGRLEDFPEGPLPELAVSGRSNVGKSSLINTLLGRKMAYISQTPGKTQTLNFYRIGEGFFLVDLPGYGYAQAPKENQKVWARLVEGYLSRRQNLRAVILLIDARHPPSPLDLQMKGWLDSYGIPTLYVATKADKIPRGKRRSMTQMIRKGFSLDPSIPIYPFSARTGEGHHPLWKAARAIVRPLP